MPTRVPRSYDEIVRATVPEPDSSFRPTEQQERDARDGFRALDVDEQHLFYRVAEAIEQDGAQALSTSAYEHVTVEVTRDTVTLHGQVPDPESLAHLLEVVRDVDGVGTIVDRLVVAG